MPNVEGKQIITTTGATTINGGVKYVYIDPSATLASVVPTFPSNPSDGQELIFMAGGTIDSGLSVVTNFLPTPAGGQLIRGIAPTTMNSGDCFSYIFRQDTGGWYFSREATSGVGSLPYVQRIQFGSTSQNTSFTLTWPGGSPVNGHLMVLYIYATSTTINSIAGWTMDNQQGFHPLAIFRRVAGAGESTTITVTTTSLTTLEAIAFELPGPYTTVGGFTGLLIDQSIASNDIASVTTTAVPEIIFTPVCYYNLTHSTDGPFSFSLGFQQLGYAQGTGGGQPQELVVGYFKSLSIGTYHSVITSTNVEAGGVFSRAAIISYK